MNPAIKLAGREETYLEMERFIGSIVSRFRRAYGGETENLMSDAGLIFMGVYETYDHKKGSFQSYLAKKVWYGLIDLLRAKYRNKEKTYDSDSPHWDYENKENPINKIKAGLTDDARAVVNLVLDSPEEIAGVIERRGGRPLHYRLYITKYLLGRGWGKLRISETFAEIKGVL